MASACISEFCRAIPHRMAVFANRLTAQKYFTIWPRSVPRWMWGIIRLSLHGRDAERSEISLTPFLENNQRSFALLRMTTLCNAGTLVDVEDYRTWRALRCRRP